jgi:hypothetical protein
MSDTIACLSNDFKYAYIDESGNYGFDFDKIGTSSHFVTSAIIINPENIDLVKSGVENVRKKYFGTGEIKYSNLKKDKDIKIFKIIMDINKLPFFIISFVTDKKKISKDSGLYYKKTFIKYLNNMLYKELKLIYNSLDIYADSHGSKEFIKEFEKYFYSRPNYNNEIFDTYKIQFVDSKSNVLIQLSDIICGIISSGFEINNFNKNYTEYLNLLRNRILKIELWPISYENYIEKIDLIESTEIDKNIAEICLKLCVKFISENFNSNVQDIIEQLILIKYLMSQLHYRNDNFVSSKELKYHLFRIINIKYDNRKFMSIIGKLRDNDVIISSCSKGYKIPISINDIYLYTSHSLSVILPMKERLEKCRRRILTITDGKLDILQNPRILNIDGLND